MGSALQRLGRCPRCGYVLTYYGQRYRCNFCGYPGTLQTLKTTVQNFERTLRSKVENLLEGGRRVRFERMAAQYPFADRQQFCGSCGIRIPQGLQNCPYCGALQNLVQTDLPPSASTDMLQVGDQKVFDYIAAHNGTISLSQGAQDLSVSPDALRLTIERLKAAGLLQQT